MYQISYQFKQLGILFYANSRVDNQRNNIYAEKLKNIYLRTTRDILFVYKIICDIKKVKTKIPPFSRKGFTEIVNAKT